ncbi:hypothetical protein ACJX0J_020643, partial [Zea mays]
FSIPNNFMHRDFYEKLRKWFKPIEELVEKFKCFWTGIFIEKSASTSCFQMTLDNLFQDFHAGHLDTKEATKIQQLKKGKKLAYDKKFENALDIKMHYKYHLYYLWEILPVVSYRREDILSLC